MFSGVAALSSQRHALMLRRYVCAFHKFVQTTNSLFVRAYNGRDELRVMRRVVDGERERDCTVSACERERNK